MNTMKKIIYILSLCSLVFLTSCEDLNTTVVTMEDGVDARVSAVMQEYQKAMTSAPYGWIFNVMTNEGYYQFHMVFTADNKVSMYTDNQYYYEEYYDLPKVSTWNMRSLQRPVLSFDTYSYIHIINDPDNQVSYGTDNMALGTDFEFEVDDYTDGVFNFTGRVNRIPATMRQATAAEFEKVKAGGLMDVIAEPPYYNEGLYNYFEVGGTKVALYLNGRSVDVSYVSGGKPMQGSSFVMVDLDYNMTLVEPIEIEGKMFDRIDLKNGTFFANVGGSSTEVKGSEIPIVPLHMLLGEGLPYSMIDNIISMYPDLQSNEFAYYEYVSYYYSNAYGYPMQEVQLSFYQTEGGEDRMMMWGLFGRYQGWATFYIKFNDDRSEFTVEKMTYDDDLYGNMSGAFYNMGASYFLDFMIGKTFRIEWSNVKFGSYSMGQLTDVEDPNSFFCGALF